MLMGYREYARHRGCTLRAVQNAIADGRISAIANSLGRKQIDSDQADAAWLTNTDPAKRSPLFSDGPTTPLDSAPQSPGAEGADDFDEASGAVSASPEYRQARTEQLQIRVTKERMELEILQKRYIPAAEAVRTVFTSFRALRDRVLTVPVRVKHQLAAESDAEAIERILEAELGTALAFNTAHALQGEGRSTFDEDDDEGEF
jgi:hypothetical protein